MVKNGNATDRVRSYMVMYRVEVQAVNIQVRNELADICGTFDEILTLLVRLDLFLRILVVRRANVSDLGVLELLLGHMVV